MTEPYEKVCYGGQQYVVLPACLGCVHAFIEDVDYEYFTQVSGGSMAVPMDEKPPLVVCDRDAPSLRECRGKCPFYKEDDEGGPHDGARTEEEYRWRTLPRT